MPKPLRSKKPAAKPTSKPSRKLDIPADDPSPAPTSPAPGGAAVAPGASPILGKSPQQPSEEPAQAAPGVTPDMLLTAPDTPDKRPEVPPSVIARVKEWWAETDNLVQRANALWEFREANKILFPARFNVNDPRRGQTPQELRSGKDDRRVQHPIIYRDSLQITAMTVPDDLTFTFLPVEQVPAPLNPLTAMIPVLTQGAASGAAAPIVAGQPPVSENIDPTVSRFSKTMWITLDNLLNEAEWIKKVQAWVQDSSIFPCAVLKFCFRRDYRNAYLSETPLNRDETDNLARLEALIVRYSKKEFDENSADYEKMKQLVAALKAKAEIERWWGIELTLVSMDAFGIMEDATDLVSIYDASAMFHDALKSGEEILAQFPYTEGEDGNSYGILPDELNQAVPWDQRSASTDPNSRNRISRNRQLTTPRATPANVATAQGKSVDPKKLKYLVREIWSKKDRTVYVLVRGIDHYIARYIPRATSKRWYPFAVLAPNRVPCEVYGCSDLEMKKDIQRRIHRKRSDEEKARFLAQRRYLYNSALADEKEMLKIQDIPPGQFRGANLGAQGKLTDIVMPLEHTFDPKCYDTTLDERDKDIMGAIPQQALGATGVANYATEVQVAAQGSAVALQQRQAVVRREVEGLLTCLAEILLQELTPDEVRSIAGPFAVWPEIYDANEALQLVEDAKNRARQAVMPNVMALIAQQAAGGVPISVQEIQRNIDTLAAPVWQDEMSARFGAQEPMTRDALYRRLKIKVKSSLTSSLDRQSRIQNLSLLAGAVQQLGVAAQASMVAFNPRPALKMGARLLGEEDSLDEMFPAVPPAQAAAAATPGAQSTPGSGTPAVGDSGQDSRNQGGAPQTEPGEAKAARATDAAANRPVA